MPGPRVEVRYCPGCRWLLRAAWYAQELLSTFEADLGEVALIPAEPAGVFQVAVDGVLVWDRKAEGGFPQPKQLKQRVRDRIAPGRDLGHAEAPEPG